MKTLSETVITLAPKSKNEKAAEEPEGGPREAGPREGHLTSAANPRHLTLLR